jgi:hypothetical protein
LNDFFTNPDSLKDLFETSNFQKRVSIPHPSWKKACEQAQLEESMQLEGQIVTFE